ncbi:MAG: aldo/keto reductase [Melioribacteraceae bacterium]|nr:aldo/keto reductase [Melioribacteraceae bacterium]MCF8264479.1 aldo/keto reductase [Melioribacteraceae bacterium]MCF8432628.1 aldo/keto reductase [Melioribacteraceae bacterium]
MIYKNLGRSGLKVSRLCLGTMNFGEVTPKKESFNIMDEAVNLGINFIDTANVYGGKFGEGITENIIGQWLTGNKSQRDKIVLATKVHNPMGNLPNENLLSAYHIKRACENSLKRLKTDHIDLYQIHHVDRTTPWEEIWQAFEQLITEGKITYAGSSNFAGWDLATASERANKRDMFGLVSEQSKYNLFNRKIEREVIPACEYYGIGIIPWSPLEGGLLGGVIKKRKEGRRNTNEIKDKFVQNKVQIEQWEKFCAEINEDPGESALAWLLHQKVVTSPIIGPRNVEQLKKSIRALEISFDENHLEKIDQIFPPAGIAPHYYSW